MLLAMRGASIEYRPDTKSFILMAMVEHALLSEPIPGRR